MFFLQALSIITPEVYADVTHNTSKMISPLFMNLGLWISATPMFVYGIFKMVKLRKGTPDNLEEYTQGEGRIVNVTDTRTKIQNRGVYNVEIELIHQGISQIIEKELIIPVHIIHVFSINKEFNIYINPKNIKEIYIATDYGTF